MTNTLYDLDLVTSDGRAVSLADFRGKTLLIVNTATKCGFAGQFTELESLHQKYQEQGLVVIGFPCDQFLHQEPESNADMAMVCQKNFGVTFTLSEKIKVNGEGTHPIFSYLKSKAGDGLLGGAIKWNFAKFLVGPNEALIQRYAPNVSPLSFEGDIKKLLDRA